MLVTTCTHCLSRFRVTPTQLNEKQGQVRCGRCRQVFSGFEALERIPDDDTGTRLLVAHGLRDSPAPDAAPLAPTGNAQWESITDPETLEDLHSPTPAPPPSDAPSAESAGVDPETPPPIPQTGPAPLRRPDLRGPALHLEPPPRRKPSQLWAFGAALLAVVLGAEALYAFRAPLAQRYPVLRPGLEAACAQLQCNVAWSRDESLLKLEESEMLEVPGKPREIALGARLRNLASVAQEYPYLELTLSDTSGQPAARRVLRPTDYLGRPLVAGEALAAGAELSLQLRIETPRIKPTGYELLLFYP